MSTIDWSHDFDILDSRYVLDPATVWEQLRGSCPIAVSERYGRTWMPVDYADIAKIAHDVEHFSSRDIAVLSPDRDLGSPGSGFLEAPPITSDPPIHTWARRLLLPAFGPGAIDRVEPLTVELANRLIDSVIDAGRADVAADYAQHLPVRVIAQLLGVPADDEAIFTRWAVALLQDGFTNLDKATGTIVEVIAYFKQRVVERRAVPAGLRPEDLLTLLIESEVEGETLRDRHVIGSCFLLLIAGIDTTWSAIGASLWHLATHPDDQARLRAEPDLISSAVEEFLRFYSPVTMARYVAEDIEVGGCPMRSGDKVLMTFPAGNRDPAVFEDADRFIIDRERNRHFAFGSGIHRCLGSNLARMELRVAIVEWLRRVPTFELADVDDIGWTGGQVRGPRRVPVRW